jgi:hypothetical protein
MHCSAGDVGERAGPHPYAGLVGDEERDLASDHIERLHVVAMSVQRNGHASRGLLVDEGEQTPSLVSRRLISHDLVRRGRLKVVGREA